MKQGHPLGRGSARETEEIAGHMKYVPEPIAKWQIEHSAKAGSACGLGVVEAYALAHLQLLLTSTQ